MRRFYFDPGDGRTPRIGERVVLDAEETRHLRAVLRLTNGDTLELTDGRGLAMTAVLTGGGRKDAEVEITAIDEAIAEVAEPRLALAVAVVKGRRFEVALEKAVELGVHTITPLRCEHGVIDPRAGKQDRWRGLLMAALKQSGRCHLPELRDLADPLALLGDAVGPVFFGAAPSDVVAEKPLNPTTATAHAARLRLDGHPAPPQLTVLIGPEGGWSPAELQLFAVRDAIPLILGPHVLRTETAAVVAAAALQQIRQAWLAGPA